MVVLSSCEFQIIYSRCGHKTHRNSAFFISVFIRCSGSGLFKILHSYADTVAYFFIYPKRFLKNFYLVSKSISFAFVRESLLLCIIYQEVCFELIYCFRSIVRLSQRSRLIFFAVVVSGECKFCVISRYVICLL